MAVVTFCLPPLSYQKHSFIRKRATKSKQTNNKTKRHHFYQSGWDLGCFLLELLSLPLVGRAGCSGWVAGLSSSLSLSIFFISFISYIYLYLPILPMKASFNHCLDMPSFAFNMLFIFILKKKNIIFPLFPTFMLLLISCLFCLCLWPFATHRTHALHAFLGLEGKEDISGRRREREENSLLYK